MMLEEEKGTERGEHVGEALGFRGFSAFNAVTTGLWHGGEATWRNVPYTMLDTLYDYAPPLTGSPHTHSSSSSPSSCSTQHSFL